MGYSGFSGVAARFGAALFIVSVLVLPGLSGCREAGKGLGKDVLAMVDGKPVTVEDFKAACGGKVPPTDDEKDGILRRIIYNRLVAKVAVSGGLMADPAVLNKIEDFYNDRLSELLKKKIEDGVTVSDEELRAYRKKDIMPVLMVSLMVAPTAESAEAGLSELRKGASFEEVAGKRSTVKGETDFEVNLEDELYSAGVRAVLNRMKPGELSPVMKLETGYAVFRLNSRKEPEQLWKEAEESVRMEARRQKAEAELARLVDRLRGAADLKLETRKLPDGEVRYVGAVVNGVEVTMETSLFAQGGDPHSPHANLNPQTLRAALNKKVNEILLSQEARRQGLQNDPAFQRELGLKKEEALAGTLEDKVAGNYEPTPKDMKDYYDKNKDRFKVRAKVRLSRILLSTEDEAKAVLKELKAGKDFAALARERSVDSTAKDNGGDLGFVAYEILKEPMKSALATLKPGEVSGVLKSEYGYEVLKATGRTEAGVKDFSTLTDTIRKRVILERRTQAVEALYKKVSGKAKVEVNEALLKSLKQ